MEVLLVSDLKNVSEGDEVFVDALIRSSNVRVASNKSKYLDLVLVDKDEEVSAKIWNVQDNTIKFIEETKYIRAKVVVESFKGKLQLKIIKCGNIPEVELDETKFQKVAPESVDVLVKELEETIEMIDDKAINTIVKTMYEKYKEKFNIWVAAKSMHHNYPTGLLYHTVSMLRIAKNNLKQYPGKLDKDIVLGTIILHDICKVIEYSDPYKPEITLAGKLLGHVFLSASEVNHIARKLKEEDDSINLDKVIYLIHGILSHHGKKEWGSPVEPQTIEAEMVHQIDMLDARLNMKFD